MDAELFRDVEQILRTLVDPALGDLRCRAHRSGVKAWFGPEKPPRIHFEAQLLHRKHIDGGSDYAVEIGLHAEDRDETVNEEVLALLSVEEAIWRRVLGPETEAAAFYGNPSWRRVSDVWLDPDWESQDLSMEIAGRFVDYVNTLSPLLAAGIGK